MSRTLELVLLKDFRELIKVFVEAFPYSYARFNQGPADFADDLDKYRAFIKANREQIVRAAAFGISGYTNLLKISADNSFDEYKIIYFLARAVEKNLIEASYVKIAQVHMFTMVGLLDFRLQTQEKRIKKPKLTWAMCELIRRRSFDDTLGTTGCYLTYKCVSTTPNDMAA